MNHLFDLLYAFLLWGIESLLAASLVAIPVAVVILAIDLACHRFLTARVMCWLWMLVAVRLLLPIAPESSLSVQNVVPCFTQADETDDNWQRAWHDHPTTSVGQWMALPRQHPSVAATVPSPEMRGAVDGEQLLVIGLGLLWLSVASTLMARAVLASVRFSAKLRMLAPCEEATTMRIVREVCHDLRIRQQVLVKAVPDLPAPALFGNLAPTLCMPPLEIGRLDPQQLRMIALHELMHFKRRDSLTAWLLTIVRSIHWFNPVSWLMVDRIEHYRELACDAAVRAHTLPQDRTAYARLLMHYATARSVGGLGLLGLWLAWPKRDLAARIRAFTATDEQSYRLPHRAAVALMLLLVGAGLTDATSEDLPDKKASPSKAFAVFPQDLRKLLGEEHTPAMPPVGEFESREYDLAPALAQIEARYPHVINARKWLLNYTWVPGSKPTAVRFGEDPNLITLDATPGGHAYFAQLLDEVSRFGHTWQVVVSSVVLRTKDLETIRGIDWQDAVRYAAPEPVNTVKWPANQNHKNPAGLSLSMESVSVDYAPYVVTILSANEMEQATAQLQQDRRASLYQSPKVTLFSGQVAKVCDLSQSPFVVGVTHVKGELATAAQPQIAVLTNGVELGVQTSMLDRETLNFSCELESSYIEDVSEAKMPGQDIVVQIPKATRRTIHARCQMKQGDTLLIAPLVTSADEERGREDRCYAISAQWFADTPDGVQTR